MKLYYSRSPQTGEAYLSEVFLRFYGIRYEAARTENGKPYLATAGAPQFSLTHTDGLIAVAVGSAAVGLDAERRKARRLDAVKSRLTPEEQKEDFFTLWTAKESFIKYCGGTLADMYRRLVYTGGQLFSENVPQAVTLHHFELEGCCVCLCTERPAPLELIEFL